MNTSKLTLEERIEQLERGFATACETLKQNNLLLEEINQKMFGILHLLNTCRVMGSLPVEYLLNDMEVSEL